ncbi:MAG: agmatine deiminase family protein [Bacteroidetes bacterium]|nr:agmatine deiminase family protein [Bacteroidota bacterium]
MQNVNTTRTDFYKAKTLFLNFPIGSENEFKNLSEFYEKLINLIPPEVSINLLVSNQIEYEKTNVEYIQASGLEDIWLKDFIGISTKKKIVRPFYNPNYCKCSFNENEANNFDKMLDELVKNNFDKELVKLPLKWDTSNFVTNSKIAFISDKILTDNEDKTPIEIEEIISSELGLKPIFVETNKYDTINQISSYMQFVNKNTIAISEYPKNKAFEYDNLYADRLVEIAQEHSLNVIRIKECPTQEFSICAYNQMKKKCTLSSKGLYMNFLILNDTVIIPEYSIIDESNDTVCLDYNKKVLSEYFNNVITINCDEFAVFGGLLNSICYIQ